MKLHTRRKEIRIFASTVLAGCILGGTPAHAQEATEAQPEEAAATVASPDNGEIIVTAQKRQQRLIDVPVPVSAISSEKLSTQNLVSISDYADRIPGLQYSGRRTTAISIRGLNSGGVSGPTVAFLVDDIPFSGATPTSGQSPIPDFDPATLERIEVLRGPQGTLYGAASLGGLIKYVTRDPDTYEWSGRIEAGANTVAGGDEGYSARGTLNVPIVQDRVALRLNGFYRRDPAWLDNIREGYEGEDVNTKKTWGGRATLLVKPTDNLTFTFGAMRQKEDSRNSDLSITSGGIYVCPLCQVDASAAMNFSPYYDDLSTINVLPSVNKTTFTLYSAKAEWDLGGPTLTSISGWSTADNELTNDVTSVFGGLFNLFYGETDTSVTIGNANSLDKYTQEVRLTDEGAVFDWLIGGFYTNERSSIDQILYYLDSTGGQIAVPYVGAGPTKYEEIAGYGDITWHVTDKLDLQVGGRYAHNKLTNYTTLTIDEPVQAVFGGNSSENAGKSEDSFTWLVSPSYHITPDMLGYVRVATGYRPGGANVGVTGVSANYGSDSVISYELGVKGEAVPGVFTFDLALFNIDWKDIQLQGTDAVSQLTYLTNGGRARSRGVELATSITPGEGFTFDASVTYTDAQLRESLDLANSTGGLTGEKGDALPFVPEWAINMGVQQSFALSDSLDAYLGGSVTYNGDRMSAFRNSAASATRARFELPSYVLVDLRAGVSVDGVWDLGLYARNLFNERGVVAATNRNGTSVPQAIFTQPRTLGLTVARSF